MPATVLEELELLVRSRHPLIVIDTVEDDRAEELLQQLSARLSLQYHGWTRARGLRRGAQPATSTERGIEGTQEPARALAYIVREGAALYHFEELGPHLDDPLVAAHLREAVELFGVRRGAILVTGHDVRLPESLRAHATVVRLPAPRPEEYRAVLERVLRDHAAKMPIRDELDHAGRQRLIKNLAGLTLAQAERIVSRLLLEDARLAEGDVARAAAAKRQVIEQDGLLEFHEHQSGLGEVAGLAGLKAWLAKRRAVVADPARAAEWGLGYPKGVLLLGVPGCGKSLCAKAIAQEWGVPLLKLDPANLYDKYIGDSEKNFKRAMHVAERLAPVVLWIDELEKAFASSSGDDDGGVSKRVFGSFLSWLQDRRGDVFVVATANDVAKLPPEFIRKGRFDEVFFVDLPDPAARRDILQIHLARRKQPVASIDLAALAAASEGFSGAELEEAVVAALYTAFAAGAPLSTATLLAEIRGTRPLSATMGERLHELRSWASGRTVAAA